MIVTRFAPSPTDHLHLGHAYAALTAYRAAAQGRFLLRIEDIDPIRCKPEFTAAIIEDLAWLGLEWPQPVRIQSRHMNDYAAALGVLRARGLLYACFCTRREVAPDILHAPHAAESGAICAGACRALSAAQIAERQTRGDGVNWRLDMQAALRVAGALFWHDRAQGRIAARPEPFGDVVLARKDVPASYHLCVTVDDHLQGVTLVTRGQDLFESTHIHCLLQAVLGYATPDYHHHALAVDDAGRRYAKRDKAVTLRALREQGKSATQIIAMLPILT